MYETSSLLQCLFISSNYQFFFYIKLEWQILYTNQMTQKAKKYHDGFLQLVTSGSRGAQVNFQTYISFYQKVYIYIYIFFWLQDMIGEVILTNTPFIHFICYRSGILINIKQGLASTISENMVIETVIKS